MKSGLLLFGILGLMAATEAAAQNGCTDPQAVNYNASATVNDGSCIYPTTYYTPVFQAGLPGALKEISGLTQANAAWWAHNDSGNSHDFYQISTANGAILKTIALKEADNVDWEDICSDDAAIYLGDFGNNNNDRSNLGFYRVPFEAIGNGSNQTVQPDEYTFIPFAYPDQLNFNTQPEDSTVFDCEAVVFTNGRLHLFTKNHRDYTTTHYALNPVNQTIEKLGTMNVQGMISGASVSPDGNMIVLTGYNLIGLPTVFCWMLWDWPVGSDDFFAGNKRKLEFGSALLVGQVESIGFLTNRSGYIANERTSFNGITLVDESVRQFDFGIYAPETTPTKTVSDVSHDFTLSPNPAKDQLLLNWGATPPQTVELVSAVGQVVQLPVENTHQLQLRAGLYWIRLRYDDGLVVQKPWVVH